MQTRQDDKMRASMTPWRALMAAATLAAGLALAPAQAQDASPAGPRAAAGALRGSPAQSVEQANARLAQVAQERQAVHREFAANEAVCYTKFFVNYCLDQAKEKRRAALAELRAVEVDAEHFKRADSVQKRDAELAERARKDAEEQERRTQQPLPPPRVASEAPPAPQPGPSVAQREAEHAAKVKRQAVQDAADAPKRAANVIAYEKKKAESERRQAEVARKQQENAEKQAAKEEAARKKEAAAAAAAASASKQ